MFGHSAFQKARDQSRGFMKKPDYLKFVDADARSVQL